MSLARVGSAVVLLKSGKVLTVGGWIGHGSTDSAELYDPSAGKFSDIARMTTERVGRPSATFVGQWRRSYRWGGQHDFPGGIASAELFHTATRTFERVGAVHYARIAHTATLLGDGRVLIAGGRGESVTATAEIYDPRSRQFTRTGTRLMARYKHTASLLPDGRVLIAGGSDERDWRGTISSAEIYDPRNAKFTATFP